MAEVPFTNFQGTLRPTYLCIVTSSPNGVADALYAFVR
jgi:hypothetical protein